MLPIIFGKKFPTEVVHYDVKIVPDKPKYLMRRVFAAARNILFSERNPAYDGKANAYSAGPLFKAKEVT